VTLASPTVVSRTFSGWASMALAGALLFLAGCANRTPYVRPTATIPPAFKEGEGWKLAEPSDQTIRGKWWEVFQDPRLNALEEQVSGSNQELKVAEARLEQARAAFRFSRSAYYPNVTIGTSITSFRESDNRPLRGATSPTYYPDYVIPGDVTYELDLWRRIRHTVEANRATAQANAADFESLSLSLHAELALDYFELRALDAEKQLLDSTVAAYQQALELTQSRFRGGVASQTDVAQAETQLATTQAQDIDVETARAQSEHAIAVLLGEPTNNIQVPFAPLTESLPAIPIGFPSQLLERRPDIASAERRVAAANEEIGVTKAAFFPLISLSAAEGFESKSIASWLAGGSVFWSVGPSAAFTLFDAGRRRSATEQAMALYNETVASYRQTILTAFQEVEDSLSSLRVLEREAQTQQEAVAAAERSLTLSTNRYRGGVTSYLEVITAQSAALANERAAVDILRRRSTSAVLLVKALGGGWNVSTLPPQ
jgi:NodT family efflux transporter outer membrane factor (OMF) lipoprotein